MSRRNPSTHHLLILIMVSPGVAPADDDDAATDAGEPPRDIRGGGHGCSAVQLLALRLEELHRLVASCC